MRRRLTISVKKMSSFVTLLSAEFLMVLVVFFISISLLIILIRQVFYSKQFTMDEQVFSYLSHYVTQTNTAIMQTVSFFGSQYFLIPAWLFLLGFYYYTRKDKWLFVEMLVIALSSLALMLGLKTFFNRSRPLIPLLKEVPGLSFPSGHAFMSFIFYGFLIHLVYQDIKRGWLKTLIICVLILVILFIGLSRVYLRVHFASDVLAGYCFGTISLLILVWMLRQMRKYNAKVVHPDFGVVKGKQEERDE
jgi:membrane-associated phospholipid phosphatase